MKQFPIAFRGRPENLFDIIEENYGCTRLSDDKRFFRPSEPLNGRQARLYKIAAQVPSDARIYFTPLPLHFSDRFLFGGWRPFHMLMLSGSAL